MAVAQGYGKTVTSGSVFAYDVADTRNSYIGEPTVNQYTNPDFSNGTTGWAFASWDGNVTYTTEAVTGPFGKTINALKLTKNATSAYSHFHQYNSGKYTTGNQYTLSAWVKGTGTFRGNTQWGGIVQSFTLTGDWQYVQYTVTAPNNDNFPYWAAEALTTGTVFYMVYAQSEQKSHATPFVNGTRSATQGLLPLVGNSTLNLSTVSFDSNAQMAFDGTNDRIDTSITNVVNNASYEVILYCRGNVSTYNMYMGQYLPYMGVFEGNAIYYSDYINGVQTVLQTNSGTIAYNTYYHVVCMREYNGTNTVKRIYINGNLMASTTVSGAKSAFANPDTVTVGDGAAFTWYPFYGEIPVAKIYNRALSAGEVRQNYLHYKTRFNLS